MVSPQQEVRDALDTGQCLRDSIQGPGQRSRLSLVHRRFPDEPARFLKSPFDVMHPWKKCLPLRFTVIGLSALLAGGGCHRAGDAPPQALAPEEVTPALDTAFKNANPENKQAANEVVSALQSKDDPKAFIHLQSLAARPDF